MAEDKSYDELYSDFINGRDVPHDFEPREIQRDEANERRKVALEQRHLDAIEDAKTGVNFDVGILTPEEIEKYRPAYLYEKYFQSESFRFQEFHAYPENLIIDLVTEDGPEGHMSLAGFAGKEVDKFDPEKKLIYQSFEKTHKELLHFKKKNPNAAQVEIEDFFRIRAVPYEDYMRIYEDYRYLIDIKHKIIDLDKDYSQDSSYPLKKSEIGSVFQETQKYADAEFGYNNHGHPSIRYVWSVYTDLMNYRKKVDEGGVENPKTRQIRNRVCFNKFFEKKPDGSYEQIHDFGSEPQQYTEKRVDDLSNYRRVSSFTLGLIAARAYEDMREKYMFFDQLSEIFQILHINPEDKDKHVQHSEAAIKVLRERIDQEAQKELGANYKTDLFGTEMADTYLLKFKAAIERFIVSLKLITPHFNSSIETFEFELREAARLKREAEERKRRRNEKLAKYGMIWGLILLAFMGYLAVSYNKFTAGTWVFTQRVVQAFVADEKRKFTSIAPMIGNILGSTNVEYVNDPTKMPVGGIFDMHGNMIPNSKQVFETYVMNVDEFGNPLNARAGTVTDENPEGIPYFGADKLPKGTASQLQLRVVELEQALFFKEKDMKKLVAEKNATQRELELVQKENRELSQANFRIFDTIDEKSIEPKLSGEVYNLLEKNKSQILDHIGITNLNVKSNDEMFNDLLEIATSMCPDDTNSCGYISLIPSWSEYLQPRKVEKFGSIIVNLDEKTILLN